MNDPTTQPARLAVRASDAEREQTVAVLQRNFAYGRLTQAANSRNELAPPTKRRPGPSWAI